MMVLLLQIIVVLEQPVTISIMKNRSIPEEHLASITGISSLIFGGWPVVGVLVSEENFINSLDAYINPSNTMGVNFTGHILYSSLFIGAALFAITVYTLSAKNNKTSRFIVAVGSGIAFYVAAYSLLYFASLMQL